MNMNEQRVADSGEAICKSKMATLIFMMERQILSNEAWVSRMAVKAACTEPLMAD